MPSKSEPRKQLLWMWRKNPCCHWCDKITTLAGRGTGAQILLETATLGHLYSRLDPRRTTVNRTGERRRLLACYECNQRRNREEALALEAAKRL